MILTLTARQKIDLQRPAIHCEEIIIEKHNLRRWQLSDVETCLSVEGANIPNIAHGLYTALNEGKLTPLQLLQAAQALRTQPESS